MYSLGVRMYSLGARMYSLGVGMYSLAAHPAHGKRHERCICI